MSIDSSAIYVFLITIMSVCVGFILGQKTIVVAVEKENSSNDILDEYQPVESVNLYDESDDEATKVEKLREQIERDKTNKFFT